MINLTTELHEKWMMVQDKGGDLIIFWVQQVFWPETVEGYSEILMSGILKILQITVKEKQG